MDERTLLKILSDIPLGGIRTFEQTGSTNDAALAWAADGAPDMALVLAEEQTAGRGRANRRWFTSHGKGLAFSLVLRPRPAEIPSLSLFSGLGALAVCEALEKLGLKPEIKWPNDVLLSRQKICGMLVETVWTGEAVDSLVLGIGINITPESVPLPELLNFPATSLEAELGKKVEPTALLHEILRALIVWRARMEGEEFLSVWNDRLAFRGEQVELQEDGEKSQTGELLGLDAEGGLRLRSSKGGEFTVHFGDVHLRPVV